MESSEATSGDKAADKEVEGGESKVVESEMAKETKAFLTYLDFAALHTRQCKNPESAGEKDSDFELWTPYDGRHGDNKCFLGQQVVYTRRK